MITNIYKTPLPKLEIDSNYFLREHSLDDIDAFYEYYTDPDVARYILASTPKNKAEAKEEIVYCRNLFTYKRGLYWSIVKRPENKMIGAIGIYMNNHHHRAEICYDLHKDYWRKGITSKAITAVMQYLFDDGEIHRVEALTVKENTASIKLLEKLGFRFEGALKNYRFYDQKSHDVEMYGITAEEFHQQSRT
ncbi:MAG: GNAT family N-acetyltransferase [Gammaproteobacteria bacterium]|nr:GNAT family N-acetyltransferase [Gammaproteobacteria bacterium]MCH9744951.1 GNAT family N-acetyltransferase [Gammaproteobacteria bacterium]